MNTGSTEKLKGLDLSRDSAIENIHSLLGAIRVLDIQGNLRFNTIKCELTEIAYEYAGAVIEAANKGDSQ
ncbi:hypothetical protein IR671_002389 [Salmonella enterica]|nr:hypothetical protein [Salmonella enterica]